MEGDAEIEEGQLISNTLEITRDLIETTETDISGYVGLGCENDGQVEEGQLVSDENGAVFSEIATEIERKDVNMPSVNGCMIGGETSNGCPQADIGCILLFYEFVKDRIAFLCYFCSLLVDFRHAIHVHLADS